MKTLLLKSLDFSKKPGGKMQENQTPHLSYERFVQEKAPYTPWLEDMFISNCHERSEVGEAPFNTAKAYELHHYSYLQDRYTNYCEYQYNLYANNGELDIKVTLFDD